MCKEWLLPVSSWTRARGVAHAAGVIGIRSVRNILGVERAVHAVLFTLHNVAFCPYPSPWLLKSLSTLPLYVNPIRIDKHVLIAETGNYRRRIV